MNVQKKRYFLIDAIRGAAVINMVAFHFLYDVFMVYGRDPAWYGLPAVHLWQQAICRTFICVSGFVWQWGGRQNLRRGIFLNVCGALISLVTYVAVPAEAVWFGILNFIGCAVLLLIPLDKYLQKCNAVAGLCVCLFLFALCKNLPFGTLGFGAAQWVRLPRWLYEIKVLTPIGFPFPGFTSGDYFPLLPWLFLYTAGYFGCCIFMRHAALQMVAQKKIPILTAIGQKSIWVYLLHQPLCMLLCNMFFH